MGRRTLYVVGSRGAALCLTEALPDAAVCVVGDSLADSGGFDEVVYLGVKGAPGLKEWWERAVAPHVVGDMVVTVGPECTAWERARGLC